MSYLDDLFSTNDSPMIREDYIRAPFGYPGGKSKSVKHIVPKLPIRSVYTECCGGSGAVLLARDQSKLEVFNDRYSGVTCFYRVIKDKEKLDQLVERLRLSIHSREEFMWCKSTWEKCNDEIERAARWFYMTRLSFGAQGRNFGRAVVPTNNHRNVMLDKILTKLPDFHGVHQRMQHVQIENQDMIQCLRDYDSLDTVHYIDPPYYEYATGMYAHEINKDKHKQLLDVIHELKGFVAISGYANDLYDSYIWDERVTWEVTNTSLGRAFTDTNYQKDTREQLGRGTSTEVLWIKE